MKPNERIIVALDVDTYSEAEKLIDTLSSEIDIFKVGIAPFTSYGEQVLNKLNALGKKVFLDLKVHDIPNTVKNAAKRACEKKVFMMNFHCLGGRAMLEAAVSGIKEANPEVKPILLGVTVLTSTGEEELHSLGMAGSVQDKVVELASIAKEAGLDGVVASSQEAKLIKEKLGDEFIVVTPGIRPEWAAKGDQKRVLTPRAAIEAGADYLVVGRPIIAASDPLLAAKKILQEMD